MSSNIFYSRLYPGTTSSWTQTSNTTKYLYDGYIPASFMTHMQNPFKYRKTYSRAALTHGDGHSPTPWEHSSYESEGFNHMTVSDVRNGGSLKLWGSYSGPGTPTSVTPPYSNRNDLEVAAMKNLQQAKIDIGVLLVELRETVSHLVRRTKDVAAVLSAVKRRDWRFLKSRFPKVKPKSFSDPYLEYSFAIRPLLSDINDLQTLIREGLDYHLFVTSRARLTSKPAVTRRGYSVSSGVTCHETVKIFAKVEDERLSALQQLGLANIPHALWNGVPLSFVLDWFLPIGDQLALMSADAGLMFSSAYYSCKTSGTVDSSRTYNGPGFFVSGKHYYLHQSITLREKYKSYYRDVYQSFPNPFALRLRNPFGNKGKILTAAALVTSLASH